MILISTIDTVLLSLRYVLIAQRYHPSKSNSKFVSRIVENTLQFITQLTSIPNKFKACRTCRVECKGYENYSHANLGLLLVHCQS